MLFCATVNGSALEVEALLSPLSIASPLRHLSLWLLSTHHLSHHPAFLSHLLLNHLSRPSLVRFSRQRHFLLPPLLLVIQCAVHRTQSFTHLKRDFGQSVFVQRKGRLVNISMGSFLMLVRLALGATPCPMTPMTPGFLCRTLRN